MKVSVCMITWNEEKLLAKAVESVRGLADEVVVVDTGSTDGTVALAKKLGCLVVEGRDRYHKGASRNEAINAASGEWIVILDCDEIVEQTEKIRAFLEKTDADAIYIRVAFKKENKTTLEFSQMRIWKKDTYLYKYRAHEVPIPQIDAPKIIYTDFVWQHHPVPERAGWKLTYTLSRLLLDVEENPESSRSKFYLARQYIYLKNWQAALEMFEQYLHAPDHDEADAYLYMGKAYGELGQEKEQIKALHLACAHSPGRRDWWGHLAEIYYHHKKYDIAAAYLRGALELPDPKTTYISEKWYGAHFYDLLARSLYYAGRKDDGLPYAVKALNLDPDNERLKNNLAWFNGHAGGNHG